MEDGSIDYRSEYGYRCGPMSFKWLLHFAVYWRESAPAKRRELHCHSDRDLSLMLYRETGDFDSIDSEFTAFDMPIVFNAEIPQGTFEIRDSVVA